MNTTTTPHPSPDQLAAFGLGRLSSEEAGAVESHVLACAECCRTLRGVHDDTLVELARAAARATPIEEIVPTLGGVPPELVDHPRYCILGRLGEGGMGVVYKAEHRLMERVVALKVISRRLTAKPEAVDRFRREVKAAAQLSHPNIVAAHDAEEVNGLHFLVMELVDGISLDRLVAKRGALPVGLACHFIRQAAAGLHHAHTKGLIHRDLKPHNLMVTRKGHVKVLDFGLARLAQEEDADPKGVTDPNLVIGTPDYLAPEQARNSRNTDARSDLYSLGCTFYFLLAGRTPFPGGSPFEKLIAHAESEPEALDKLRPGLPVEVEAIVRKLMAKRPLDRYPSAAELVTALTPFARQALSTPDLVPDGLPVGPPVPAAETPRGAGTARGDTEPIARAGRSALAETVTAMPRPTRRRAPPARRRQMRAWLILGLMVIVGLVAAMAQRGGPSRQGEPDALKGQVAVQVKPGEKSGSSGGRVQRPTDPAPTQEPAPNSARQPAAGGDPAPKVALFVLPEIFFFKDFDGARTEIERPGYRVVVCSPAAKVIPARGGGGQGVNVPVEKRLGPDVHMDDYHAIVFVGGDVNELRTDTHARRLVREAQAAKKLIGAICKGQQVLVEAGTLDGKRAAASPFRHGEFGPAPKVNWEEKPVVVWLPPWKDGRPAESPIVTASGPDDSKEFGEKLAFGLTRMPR